MKNPKKLINKKSNKIIVIPLEYDLWKSFKKISCEEEISMSALVREAIKKIINKYENNVDIKY